MGNLQEYGDFTWRVSDSEELVGGYSQEVMVVLGTQIFRQYSSNVNQRTI